MTLSVDSTAVSELRDLAARLFGLRFGDDKQSFLADTLGERLKATRASSVSEYLRIVLSAPEERRALAAALTVPETYFFRGSDQLRALREAVLPDRVRKRGAARELRILSAGCATGEEAYTLAMVLHDSFPELLPWKTSVLGVDLNPRSIERARKGRYSAWSLRETPHEHRDRLFRQEDPEFVVHDLYRSRVSFAEVNLLEPASEALAPGVYDVIFCRNVIMYFTPGAMAEVVRSLARSLVPSGYLFLGHAETLRGISQDFTLCHTHETFYYQLRDGPEASASETTASVSREPVQASLEIPLMDSSWVESIRASFERVDALSRSRSAEDSPPRPAAAGDRRLVAVEFLRQERFEDALDALAPLAAESAPDPETLILQAVLLCHCGRPAEAEAVCARILRADDLTAEAHYLLALCREHAGELERAIEQDRIAQYLDPNFAMPRLHAGRLARKRGDFSLARRELDQALALLAREEPSRILLFGGGFGREALIQVCRAEREACGRDR